MAAASRSRRKPVAARIGFAPVIPRRTLVPLLAAAILAPAGLVACGEDPNPAGAVLDRDQLEQDIRSRLQQAGAGESPSVDCPSDLPTVKGASIRCRATLSGGTYGVTVTITGGEGKNAVYELNVDRQPS